MSLLSRAVTLALALLLALPVIGPPPAVAVDDVKIALVVPSPAGGPSKASSRRRTRRWPSTRSMPVASASGRPVSDSGRLRHGEGTHGSGARRRRVLELPTLCAGRSRRAG